MDLEKLYLHARDSKDYEDFKTRLENHGIIPIEKQLITIVPDKFMNELKHNLSLIQTATYDHMVEWALKFRKAWDKLEDEK